MKNEDDGKYAQEIRKLHLDFAENRGFEKTYCPSEVARAFRPELWRTYMDLVRVVADNLIGENKLVVLQNGKIISESANGAKGPIRLRHCYPKVFEITQKTSASPHIQFRTSGNCGK